MARRKMVLLATTTKDPLQRSPYTNKEILEKYIKYTREDTQKEF